MLCKAFERKDFEIFSVDQGLLRMSQLCNCIHELLNVFEVSAQHVHTIVCQLHSMQIQKEVKSNQKQPNCKKKV